MIFQPNDMKLFDVYPLYDVTPVRAKDVYVYDSEATEYLDLYGGHAVISIGHGHPRYIERITDQIHQIGFYSNAVQNPLQNALAEAIALHSCCHKFELFLCSSGAEANENALKLASFHTQQKRIIAFDRGFHGRTSAAVAATDNPKINAPLNRQQQVSFLPFDDERRLEEELKKGDVCAVIFEAIQGVGGLDEPSESFVYTLERLCNQYRVCLIADEVQAGFSRTGTFFAFQKYQITPHIITMAKGMGNGFPIGGLLIHPNIKAKHGLLGTTFGGNHLACSAALAVLDVLKEEKLQQRAKTLGDYFFEKADQIPQIKSKKGRGLMLGLEFDFDVSALRKELIYTHHIFTGGSSNKNILRVLPPLSIQKKHFDLFFKALETALKTIKT